MTVLRLREYGWDYPPGAEQDPRAPWNQADDEGDRPLTQAEISAIRDGEREDDRNCNDD